MVTCNFRSVLFFSESLCLSGVSPLISRSVGCIAAVRVITEGNGVLRLNVPRDQIYTAPDRPYLHWHLCGRPYIYEVATVGPIPESCLVSRAYNEKALV